jgi:hypothetical protein
LAAAVADIGAAADIELVASGVTTEVVVIIEEEDSRPRIVLQVEMRRGQATEACADNNQVIDA